VESRDPLEPVRVHSPVDGLGAYSKESRRLCWGVTYFGDDNHWKSVSGEVWIPTILLIVLTSLSRCGQVAGLVRPFIQLRTALSHIIRSAQMLLDNSLRFCAGRLPQIWAKVLASKIFSSLLCISNNFVGIEFRIAFHS